jgi:hypothetical protein
MTSKVKYHLSLTLHDRINVSLSRHEYQAVGKQHFILAKARQPARWKQLYADKKPINYRLWLHHHEQFVQALWSFRGDAVYQFEGHQWMED